MNRISRFATTVVLQGALGLAGFALGAGTAQADTWCPGDYMFTGIPNWNMSVCHDYYWAHKYDLNAPMNLYFEGPPPGRPAPGFCGRDMFTGIPLPCQAFDGIDIPFHATEVGTTLAKPDGSFTAKITILDTPLPNQQFNINVTGKQSIRHDSAPFMIT